MEGEHQPRADYLPSRLSLAEALARQGQSQQAEEQYRAVLGRKPDYIAARHRAG